jgi:hypothetical protein
MGSEIADGFGTSVTNTGRFFEKGNSLEILETTTT